MGLQHVPKNASAAARERAESSPQQAMPAPHDALNQLQQSPQTPPSGAVLSLQRCLGNQQTKRLLRQTAPQNTLQRETPAATDAPAQADNAEAAPTTLDVMLKRLLAGEYSGKGQYTEKDGTFERFADDELNMLLVTFMSYWAPAIPEQKVASGDSSGKSVAEHPDWVKSFQTKLIGQSPRMTDPKKKPGKSPAWDDNSEAAQRLVEAYLNAWSAKQAGKGEAASNVQEFIHQIGVSQTNDQAMLLGGSKGLYDWCAISTGRAIALGLMRQGLRFKAYNPPKTAAKNAPTAVHLQTLMEELNSQASLFQNWSGESTSQKDSAGDKARKKKAAIDKGRVISGKEANTAELKPGDFISIIFGGLTGPISGHVATVVKEDKTNPNDGDNKDVAPNTTFSRVSIVSGNAAGVYQGETAVRIESFNRQRPPDEYPEMYSKMMGPANEYQYVIKKAADKARKVPEATRSDAEKALIKRADYLLGLDFPVHKVDGNKFKPGIHAPVEGDSGWILSITRSSMLNANEITKQLTPDGKIDPELLKGLDLEVFDESSRTVHNEGINKLYPGVLAMYE